MDGKESLRWALRTEANSLQVAASAVGKREGDSRLIGLQQPIDLPRSSDRIRFCSDGYPLTRVVGDVIENDRRSRG